MCNHKQPLKNLQQERMSALRGKGPGELSVQTLENIRNENDFSLLCKKIKSVAQRNSANITNSTTKKDKKA